MARLTDGNWKIGNRRMVVAVSLDGVSAEAARTYGGGRIICKFFHSSDGELIASAPEMQYELALLKRKLQKGQNFILAAYNSPEAMICVADCLEAFGFTREAQDGLTYL